MLVIDEWEAAGTAEADELLSMLIEGLGIRWLITSRTRPSCFSPRLEAYGEGIVLSIDELAMTDAEARSVLSCETSLNDQTALVKTARGWPAVLGLAAMRRAADLPRTSVAGRVLFEYLATELMGTATALTHRGLTLAAAAGVSDLATIDLLLDGSAQAFTEEVTRLGLARIGGDASFEVHPLLRDLLLEELKSSVRSDEGAFVEHLARLIALGCWDEALTAAEMTDLPAYASRALEAAIPHFLAPTRVGMLRRWVAVGRRIGHSSGLVDLADAEVALREGDFARAISRGRLAGKVLDEDLAARAHLVVASAASLSNQLSLSRQHGAQAIRLASSADTTAAALWTAFIQAVDEEREDASAHLQKFEAQTEASPEQLLRVAHGIIRIGMLEGGLDAARTEAKTAIPLVEDNVDPMVSTAFLNLSSGAAAFAGSYQESLELAEQEFAVASMYELDFVKWHALLNQVRAAVGLRQIRVAERALADLDRSVQPQSDQFVDASRAIERARLYITIGDLNRAFDSLALDMDRSIDRWTRGEHLGLRALILAARGDNTLALKTAAEATRVSRMAEVRCLCAATELLADSTTRVSAGAFLKMTSEIGGWDVVVMASRASPDFARLLAEQDSGSRSKLREVFHASNDTVIARRLGLQIPRAARPAARLSPREQEIHELIAQGLTNPEIARLLFISESTTKVHVRHILEKLGVRSRVEAARMSVEPPS
ncbi:MAG TPA: LuxR C-terminal-related transcriptional regulator [Gemmatimonadaceae bacterium]|nr:LuxR C-terminal-related transcriptional regulator [Gemmatimonadaceae bacterium]